MPRVMSEKLPRTRSALGERELIAMMAMIMSLQAFGMDAMLPALGQMGSALGADGNDRQLVIGVYMLGSGIGAILPGVVADRFGRRPVLAVALLLYFVFSLACSFVTDYDTMIALRFVQGVATAGLSVMPATIVRDQMGGDKMAKMMSLIMMVFMIVPLVAPAIGQVVLDYLGWRAIFDVMAFAGLAVGIWVYFRLPETLLDENRQAINPPTIVRNMVAALSDRGSIGYVVASAVIFGALFGFLNTAQQLIGEAFDAQEDFAFVFAAAVSGLVVANFTNSRIVERYGARRVSQTALFVFIFTGGLQLLSSSQPDQTLTEFIVLLAINMGLLGFIAANFGSISMQPFFAIAGAASSAQTFVRTATGAVLGMLIGQAYDGTALPFAIALVLAGVIALLLVLFSERGKLFTRPNAPS